MPVFMSGPKPMQTEFGVHLRELCSVLLIVLFVNDGVFLILFSSEFVSRVFPYDHYILKLFPVSENEPPIKGLHGSQKNVNHYLTCSKFKATLNDLCYLCTHFNSSWVDLAMCNRG